MKKIIEIILVLVMFVSCSEMVTENPSSSSTLSKKPITPVKVQEPLLSLSIGGNSLIADNNILVDNMDEHPDVSLSENMPLDISYSIKSSADDPILFVQINLLYDSNVDNKINSNREFGGTVIRDTLTEAENITSISESIPWDGFVEAIAENDPIYADGNFQITDQLATAISNPEYPNADHYYVQIMVQTKNYFRIARSYIWLNNTIPPASTFHVEDIEIVGVTTVRNQYTPEFKVQVLDQTGEPIVGADVHVVFNDDYEVNVGRLLFKPTNTEGWATVSSTFDRKSLGELKMTVVGVQYYNGYGNPMAVYNPIKNNTKWGAWPENKPSMTISMPGGIELTP